MKYSRKDAKDYASRHLRGIWAAALMPFTPNGAMDEDGFVANILHWTGGIWVSTDCFIAGKQGEFLLDVG